MCGKVYLIGVSEFHSTAWSLCKQNGVVVLLFCIKEYSVPYYPFVVYENCDILMCIHIHLWIYLVTFHYKSDMYLASSYLYMLFISRI